MSTGKAIGGAVGAFAILITANVLPQFMLVVMDSMHIFPLLIYPIAGSSYLLLAYFMLKIFSQKILGLSLETMGIQSFKIDKKWVVVAFVLPITVIGIFMLLPGQWQMTNISTGKQLENIFFGIFFIGLAAGFVEEMVFRGVILYLFEQRWNKFIAVFFPSIVFGSIHIIGQKLSFLSFLQLVVAGTLVGIMFSLIKLATHTVWSSAIVHMIWNSMMMGGFIFIGPQVESNALMTYVLKVDHFLLTGGDFGIEASVIAMIAYSIVSLMAYRTIKKDASI